MRKRWPNPLTLLAAMTSVVGVTACAGPPFLTDDPEPVEYKHGEFYVFSILDATNGPLLSDPCCSHRDRRCQYRLPTCREASRGTFSTASGERTPRERTRACRLRLDWLWFTASLPLSAARRRLVQPAGSSLLAFASSPGISKGSKNGRETKVFWHRIYSWSYPSLACRVLLLQRFG